MTRVLTLPRVAVSLGGGELPLELGETLVGLSVRHELALPAQCEATFHDHWRASVDDRAIEPGTPFEVAVDDATLFSGEVTAIERVYAADGNKRVRVRGYDVLHRLKKTQPVRTFKDSDAAALASELVRPLGLDVSAAHDGPVWPLLVQYRQSDLELLVDVTRRCGLYPVVLDGRLELVDLRGRGEPVRLVLGESALELRITVNADAAAGGVAATGWDTSTVELRTGAAAEAGSGRVVAASVPASSVGADGDRSLVDESTSTDAQADALAQAELDRRVAAEVTLWAAAPGHADLRPATVVDVSGVADSVSGRYVVTSVVHTVDQDNGFVTEISTDPPRARLRPRGASVTVGVVADVDDPGSIGRVRLRLPAHGDVETEWIPVVMAAGGPSKGLIALPDVDDHVLVVLAHEDPARAFVLGGLYGADGPPDAGVVDGDVRRFTFLTAGGHKVVLDDEAVAVRLEDATGSFLEMSPSAVRLHSEANLQIDAPGKAVVVRGNTVDFMRAEEPD
ncbi:MAG TPA: phage baseplate assembly protein V [Actinomycetota bacterium]|nr:phage baseplate assembly protein V [Actinomycetota bacterium]